jgi:hypothetical protein
VIILIGGVLLTMIPVFDGKRIFTRKFFHFKWYVKYLRMNKDDDSGIAARNRIKDLLLLPVSLIRNRGSAFQIIFYKNSFLIAAYSLPVFFLFLYFVCTRFGFIVGGDWLLIFCMYLVMAAVAVFILTSLRPLLFLGHAERYYEYAVFPLSLVSVYLVSLFVEEATLVILLFVMLNICLSIMLFLVVNYRDLRLKFVYHGDRDFQELIDFLDTQKDPVIMTLPTKFAFKIAYHMKSNASFYYDNVCHPKTGMEYMLNEHRRLHYFKTDFNYFKDTYGITLFIFSQNAVTAAENQGMEYDFGLLKKRFENKTFYVGELVA